MNRLYLSVLAATFLAAATGRSDDKGDAAKEYARFEGTWKFASIEAEGAKMPAAAFKDARLVIKGNRFTMTMGDVSYKGTYKVDVSKSPKQIDVTFTEGPEKGKAALGIYELTADTYKVCIGTAGKPRPKAFVSKAGSGHVLEVLKREKSEPKKKD
jgi:uncharacterized protein (TIGR03067 family)